MWLIAVHAELATATGEFAQTISDLAASDVGAQLSQSLSGLADVERKSQELHTIQSDQDLITILAVFDEYSRLINSVRVSRLFSPMIFLLIDIARFHIEDTDILSVEKFRE